MMNEWNEYDKDDDCSHISILIEKENKEYNNSNHHQYNTSINQISRRKGKGNGRSSNNISFKEETPSISSSMNNQDCSKIGSHFFVDKLHYHPHSNKFSSPSSLLGQISCEKLIGGLFLTHFTLCYRHNLREYGTPFGHMANLWICNSSLLLSGMTLLFLPNYNYYHTTLKKDFVSYAMISVSTVHILWTLDTILILLSFFYKNNSDNIIGRGPLHIADYNFFRQDFNTSQYAWYRVLMSSHHMWFLPLSIYYLKKKPLFGMHKHHNMTIPLVARSSFEEYSRFKLSIKHYIGAFIWAWILYLLTWFFVFSPLSSSDEDCIETFFPNNDKTYQQQESLCIFININFIQRPRNTHSFMQIFHLFNTISVKNHGSLEAMLIKESLDSRTEVLRVISQAFKNRLMNIIHPFFTNFLYSGVFNGLSFILLKFIV